MKSKLVIKNLVILLVLMIIVMTISCVVTNNVLVDQDKDYLQKLFKVISSDIVYGDEASYHNACEQKDVDVRVTIIDKNGNVLAESKYDIEGMDNHIDRKEVDAILKGSTSYFDVRKSATGNANMVYYAGKVSDVNNLENFVILRISCLSAGIFRFYNIALPVYVTVALVLLIIFILIIVKTNKKIEKSIDVILSGLDSIDDEKFVKISPTLMDDNLNKSVNKINALQDKIQNNMISIENEKVRLKELLQSLEVGVIILDTDCNIYLLNDVIKQIYSIKGDVVGKHITSINLDVEVYNNIKDAQLGNCVNDILLKKDKKYYNITINKTEQNIIVLYNDITSIKEYSNYKDEFFDSASHELKTPVTSIVGFAELCQNTDNIEEKEKYIDRINTHSKRLMKLILDMLEVSKLDKIDKFVEIKKISIEDVAQTVLKNYELQIKENDIQCNISGRGVLRCNYNSIEELLNNLISNAIRYNKKGGSIYIEINQLSEGINLVIKDTGIGIDKSDIDRIFERFYCVDKSRSKKTGGTGLGLSIVSRIVNLYDGKISVNSKIDLGTEFDIILHDRKE